MEILTNITIFLYMVGTAGYFAYLFFQKDYLQKSGFATLCSGFILHTATIAIQYLRAGHFPAGTLNQTLFIAAWAVVGVYLWVQYQYRLKILGIYAAPLAAFVMVMAARFSGAPDQTNTIFNHFWFLIHILGVFIGEAALALACGVGILYLIQEHAIKSKTRGFFYKRLPSLDLLDLTGHACIIIGFIMLTLGLITGFVYAQSLWGRFWSGDPKEIWSLVSWLIYAALIHQRFTVGWQGRKSAIMAIIGFAVLLFTLFGVNFLFQGHHQEFTRW